MNADDAEEKKVENIEVRVNVEPKDAKLYIDGEQLGQSPYAGMFEKDDQQHELKVEAPGYETETRKLRFERDVLIELSLKKTPSGRVVAGITRKAPDTKKPNDDLPDLSSIPKKKTNAAPIDKGDDPWK